MIDAVAAGAYRATMGAAATAAGLAARLPGAPERWQAWTARLGRLEAGVPGMMRAGTALWIHAASVGELTAARPLLARLRERYPGRSCIVSTLTRTGLELARTLPEAHLAILFPLDAPRIVRRLLAQVRLEAFLFTETEIWPTFLGELARLHVPAVMVSGRVSARTAARARWLRPVYRRALAGVTCCMQAEEDARRIIALGADARHVQVAGSLKFEAASSDPPAGVRRLAAALGLPERRLVAAGSTHAGEEEIVLAAFTRLAVAHPDVVLLLAPRHPERFAGVAALVEAQGLPLVRYGMLLADERPATVPRGAVVLLDAVGPLAQCYALAAAAFVGGSLVAAGGHNLLEPARAARPVLFGPHTEHVSDVAERLIAGGGGVRVSSAEVLAVALDHLLAEPERAAEMGRRARALVQSGQGALERHLKIIAARLGSASFARDAVE